MKFFSYDFLFYVNTVRLEPVDQVFAGVAIGFIVLAVVLKFVSRLSKHPVKRAFIARLFRLTATIGIVEALWYGLRSQNIRTLGSHFGFLLVLLIGLVWLGFILKYWWKEYGLDKKHWDNTQVKQKYLK